MLRALRSLTRRPTGRCGALDGVSLDGRPRASVTAVLGANGAGKTTLLRAISGLVRARSGRIAFDGREHRPARRTEKIARLGIAHVPEGRGSDPRADRRGEPAARRAAAARPTRGDVDRRSAAVPARWRERRDAAGRTLSGGEQQMLAIGRALMARPRLLLLDEPSLGLAPRVTAQIFAVLRDLREREPG